MGPNGMSVIPPSACAAPPMTAMISAAHKTFCIGSRRNSAAIVPAVASEISSASGHSGLSGTLAEVQSVTNATAKTATTKTVSTQ